MQTPLPTFMEKLVQNNELTEALKWAEDDEEGLWIFALASEHDDAYGDTLQERATEYARSTLHTTSVDAVHREGDTLHVDAGPFDGYHVLRKDPDGTLSVSEHGSYTHESGCIEFDAECPNEAWLNRTARRISTTEPRDAAAEAAWRRSRL